MEYSLMVTTPIHQLSSEKRAAIAAAALPEDREWILNGKAGPTPSQMPSVGKMAKGFMKTAGQALANGKVTREVRDERYATCEACPMFNPESKRCRECGCFMQAKTWIAGDKKMLCPLDKWSR